MSTAETNIKLHAEALYGTNTTDGLVQTVRSMQRNRRWTIALLTTIGVNILVTALAMILQFFH